MSNGESTRPRLGATDVEDAAEKLRSVLRRTPVHLSRRLSDLAGVPVWLKREDLQSVRSYKLRGAHLFLDSLPAGVRSAGVAAASAGNHAQGVAQACSVQEIHGRIYVPGTTPRQKRDRIVALGGPWVELVLVGDTFDDAAEAAADDAERTGATLVPPFDHPVVMAGQGTVALEAIEQLRTEHGREPSTVVLPVGGGGLLAGCGAWLRERTPSVRIMGVEPAGAVSMAAAVRAGRPVTLNEMDRFVDGAAVRRVGAGPLAMVQAIEPELVAVEEGAVCTEMLSLYQVDGIIAEPAGALAATAVATGTVKAEGDVLVVVSGGNNDVSRYHEILERSMVHEGLKHYFLVTFAQEPGALRRFLDQVLGPDDDIVLFDYIKRNNREEGPALVGLEIGHREDLEPLMARMAASNMGIERIDPSDPIYRYLT
ncbi:threonine ammonia-lyase IlvA [Brachybacterium muris]|uniref:threonine ammonia-lyase IlvA n=1 Tax=Brachybacterium muris TaxID=219301 RepID=UPI0019584AF6|nr:threonine ammonia-lyase IlvA [Brachybacterium muris]MBM7499782.1 threonine dehydratase [Brachybacterium muris]MCT1997550.1 threonine ammonia-lyase IlvA [Brachybacterium muris]MCT2177725.1 threonine ammonia-lyase IlvA [Brachybacterium muris]MCT2260864.1 threonine ammonia-lyase IlvA [Brachybacterium muris]MCT2295254.1 threonine ammonia-lyase IlvA [Brachybacterium muris]